MTQARQDIKAGDEVLYSAAFLKSVPWISGQRKGKVTRVDEMAGKLWATVVWADDPTTVKLVFAANLRPVRTLHLEL